MPYQSAFIVGLKNYGKYPTKKGALGADIAEMNRLSAASSLYRVPAHDSKIGQLVEQEFDRHR
ncbi:MAG: hypothetical protein ACLSB9_14585 [Hydrogeniiclostridium mannosilyticum]